MIITAVFMDIEPNVGLESTVGAPESLYCLNLLRGYQRFWAMRPSSVAKVQP